MEACGSRSFPAFRRKRLEAVNRKSVSKVVEQLLHVVET